MRERTSRFGVVLAIHGPQYCLEVRMSVNTPGQPLRAEIPNEGPTKKITN